MPQGKAKKAANPNQKQKNNLRARIGPHKRHYKKRKDPLKAALIRKAEGAAMAKALKSPLDGGMHLVKPSEEKAAVGTISTKKLLKNPKAKPKAKKEE